MKTFNHVFFDVSLIFDVDSAYTKESIAARPLLSTGGVSVNPLIRSEPITPSCRIQSIDLFCKSFDWCLSAGVIGFQKSLPLSWGK